MVRPTQDSDARAEGATKRIGVVLAGGAGKRLGRAKGSVELDGRTLARRAAEVLSPFCDEVVVSIGPESPNPAPGFRALCDPPPGGLGPLQGIDVVFGATGGADLLVLACDYPRVDGRILGALIGQDSSGADVVLVRGADGRDHPLVALWKRPAAGAVRAALEARRYTVHRLLERLSVRRVGPALLPAIEGLDRMLLNVNRPADLDALR